MDDKTPGKNPMAAEDRQYQVDTPGEVAAILRAMARNRALVTAWYGEGGAFALTSVLKADVRHNELVLDHVRGDHATRLLASRHILCTGNPEGVEVRFVVESLETVEFEGAAAFRSALPKTLLRLQRRAYFRVAPPAGESVMCTVPTSAGVVEGRVLDVSCGGISFLVPGNSLVLERGAILHGCRLQLPCLGTVETGLHVAHVVEQSGPLFGLAVHRCGCEFVGISERHRQLVQRYVMTLQRIRNARLSGLR